MQPGEKFGGGIGLLTGPGGDQILAGGPQGVVALAVGWRELVVELQAPLLHGAPGSAPGGGIDFPPVSSPSRAASQPQGFPRRPGRPEDRMIESCNPKPREGHGIQRDLAQEGQWHALPETGFEVVPGGHGGKVWAQTA